LLVAGEHAASRAALSALAALGTQVSLALESSALTEELHRRSSEARFRSLVQNTHDLIIILDSSATVIYQSPSIERALGYTSEEIAGTQFDRLLLPGQNSRLLHLLVDGAAYSGGDGEVIEPDDGDGVVAIGSGGPYAHAAAAALLESTDLAAEDIARRALLIAARLCIYTNDNITVETLELATPAPVPA